MLKNTDFLTILEQFQKKALKFLSFQKRKIPISYFSNQGIKMSTDTGCLIVKQVILNESEARI